MKVYLQNLNICIFLFIFFKCLNYVECKRNKYGFEPKFPFCDNSKADISQLYNPLLFAFEIFKKGFCKVRYPWWNIKKNKDESNEIEDKSKEIEDNVYKKLFNDNVTYINTNGFNLKFPIMLPSGRCSKPLLLIKHNEYKKTTCRIKNYEVDEYLNTTEINKIYYIVDDNYLNITSSSNTNNNCKTYKSIQYIFQIRNLTNIFIYCSNDQSLSSFSITFEAKFYDNNNYLNEMGNNGGPGYIPSSYINVGVSNNEYYLLPRIFIGGNSDGICIDYDNNNEKNYYYDANFDSSFTFEDTIIYGCKKNNNEQPELIKLAVNDYYFSRFKNINSYWIDNQKCDWNNNNNLYTLNFLYTETGIIQNPQNALLYGKCQSYSIDSDYNYIKVKYYRKDLETIIHTPKTPGFVLLPDDIMYPFQNYQQSKK